MIYTADPFDTGIDMYLGIGGAPEGVLAAAARCNAGSCSTPKKSARAARMGINDPRKKYEISDMVKGDCLFTATGVTDGALLEGVRFDENHVSFQTNPVVSWLPLWGGLGRE